MAGVQVTEEQERALVGLMVKDSKLLSAAQREALFDKILEVVDNHVVVQVHPPDIDEGIRTGNLNWLEADHNAAIVNKLSPRKVYIDCPSPNLRAYKNYVMERVQDKTVRIICAHKADVLYPAVSAASILAKVIRDREVERIKKEVGTDCGSGYLHDPRTKEFLENHWQEYPTLFRQSWKPYQALKHKASQKTLGEY